MKKLKHTKAPITQANSTATMDKINEIIDEIKEMNKEIDKNRVFLESIYKSW